MNPKSQAVQRSPLGLQAVQFVDLQHWEVVVRWYSDEQALHLPFEAQEEQPIGADGAQQRPLHRPLWHSVMAAQLLPSRPQLPLASHLEQPFNADALQHRPPPHAPLWQSALTEQEPPSRQ